MHTAEESPEELASTIADLLVLARVEENTFEGWCHHGRPGWIYGGHVAGQAIVAAGATVSDARPLHSMHAYFVRAGRDDEPVSYQVERTRDGRSFSVRQVHAVQRGETIFTLIASFQAPEDGFTHQLTDVTVPPPPGPGDEVRSLIAGSQIGKVAQMLPAGRDLAGARQQFWVRMPGPLGDDQLTHAAALTYLSDMMLTFTATLPHRGGELIPVTSLDHALWLHRPLRVDDWLYLVHRSTIAAGARGMAAGEFYTPDGTLVASVQQEALIRVPR